MSKKNRRQSRNISASKPSAQAASSPAQAAIKPASSYEFNPDYTYVKRDLKRIAILAVSFILILVVLSFYLR